MPGVAHLIYGMFVVIPFFIIAKEKINYKAAVIFVLNSWNGPDSWHPWKRIITLPEGFGSFHNVFNFFIWAILLSLFYTYLSRFSIQRSDHFFKIVDDGKRDINWRNAYLLCCGGGILHRSVDGLFQPGHDIDIFFNTSTTLDELLSWGQINYQISGALIIIGFCMMITVSLLIIYFLNKDVKEMIIFTLITVVIVFVIQFGLGTQATGENDAIPIAYNLFYLFIPLVIFAYVNVYVYDNPTEPPKESRIQKESILKIVAGIVITLAIAVLVLGISSISGESSIISRLGGGGDNTILIIVGILLIVLGIVSLISGVGLILNINICRYFVILLMTLLYFFIFPFAIALFLCDNDIKDKFKKRNISSD